MTIVLWLVMLFCHSSYSTMCTIHCDLVSFPFLHHPYNIPTLYFEEFFTYLSPPDSFIHIACHIVNMAQINALPCGYINLILGSLFTLFTCFKVKGLTKKLYLVIVSRRKTRFYAYFTQVHCSHCLLVFTWLWAAL